MTTSIGQVSERESAMTTDDGVEASAPASASASAPAPATPSASTTTRRTTVLNNMIRQRVNMRMGLQNYEKNRTKQEEKQLLMQQSSSLSSIENDGADEGELTSNEVYDPNHYVYKNSTTISSSSMTTTASRGGSRSQPRSNNLANSIKRKKTTIVPKDVKNVLIHESVQVIEDESFLKCLNLESVTFWKATSSTRADDNNDDDDDDDDDDDGRYNLIEIGHSAFSECVLLEQITIPSSVMSLGRFVFQACDNLKYVNLSTSSSSSTATASSGLKSIPQYAFRFCFSLRSIDLPSSLQTIEDYAFGSCAAMEAIVLPEGIQSIGSYAFCDCQALREIQFPSTLRYLGSSVFTECKSLRRVEWIASFYTTTATTARSRTKATIAANTRTSSAGSTATIYEVSDEDDDDDEDAHGNSNNKKSRFDDDDDNDDDTLKELGGYTFSGCSALKDVIGLPEGIEKIGPSAFLSCGALETMEIPSNVKVIEKSTFSFCSSLKYIELPMELEEIGFEAFFGCKSLSNLDLPPHLKRIGTRAFSHCHQINKIDLPLGLEQIGSEAFRGCNRMRLSTTTMPRRLQEMGDDVFPESINAWPTIHHLYRIVCLVDDKGSGTIPSDTDADNQHIRNQSQLGMLGVAKRAQDDTKDVPTNGDGAVEDEEVDEDENSKEDDDSENVPESAILDKIDWIPIPQNEVDIQNDNDDDNESNVKSTINNNSSRGSFSHINMDNELNDIDESWGCHRWFFREALDESDIYRVQIVGNCLLKERKKFLTLCEADDDDDAEDVENDNNNDDDDSDDNNNDDNLKDDMYDVNQSGSGLSFPSRVFSTKDMTGDFAAGVLPNSFENHGMNQWRIIPKRRKENDNSNNNNSAELTEMARRGGSTIVLQSLADKMGNRKYLCGKARSHFISYHQETLRLMPVQTTLFGYLETYAKAEEILPSLEKSPELLRLTNLEEETPLHVAVKKGYPLQTVMALLKAWPLAIYKKTKAGDTVLHLAVQSALDPEELSNFRVAWPNVMKTFNQFRRGYSRRVLMEGGDNDVSDDITGDDNDDGKYSKDDKSGRSHIPLCFLDVTAALLEAWPDALKETNISHGDTPFHVLMRMGRAADLVPVLFETWPDALHVQNKDGDSPLGTALKNDDIHVDVIEELFRVDRYAARERKKGTNENFVHYCMREHERHDLVLALLSSWPDAIQEKNSDGKTPLHVCIERNVVPLQLMDAVVSKYPDSALIKNAEGYTALHLAIDRRKHPNVIFKLLEVCGDAAKEKNVEGNTPLHALIQNRYPLRFVEALLHACPDAVSVTDALGQTPLLCCIKFKAKLNVIERIYKAWPGAAEERNEENKSLVDYLKDFGAHPNVARMFASAGYGALRQGSSSSSSSSALAKEFSPFQSYHDTVILKAPSEKLAIRRGRYLLLDISHEEKHAGFSRGHNQQQYQHEHQQTFGAIFSEELQARNFLFDTLLAEFAKLVNITNKDVIQRAAALQSLCSDHLSKKSETILDLPSFTSSAYWYEQEVLKIVLRVYNEDQGMYNITSFAPPMLSDAAKCRRDLEQDRPPRPPQHRVESFEQLVGWITKGVLPLNQYYTSDTGLKPLQSLFNKIYIRRGQTQASIIGDMTRMTLFFKHTEDLVNAISKIETNFPDILEGQYIKPDTVGVKGFIDRIHNFKRIPNTTLIPYRLKANSSQKGNTVPLLYNLNFFDDVPEYHRVGCTEIFVAYELQLGVEDEINRLRAAHIAYERGRIFDNQPLLKQFVERRILKHQPILKQYSVKSLPSSPSNDTGDLPSSTTTGKDDVVVLDYTDADVKIVDAVLEGNISSETLLKLDDIILTDDVTKRPSKDGGQGKEEWISYQPSLIPQRLCLNNKRVNVFARLSLQQEEQEEEQQREREEEQNGTIIGAKIPSNVRALPQAQILAGPFQLDPSKRYFVKSLFVNIHDTMMMMTTTTATMTRRKRRSTGDEDDGGGGGGETVIDDGSFSVGLYANFGPGHMIEISSRYFGPKEREMYYSNNNNNNNNDDTANTDDITTNGMYLVKPGINYSTFESISPLPNECDGIMLIAWGNLKSSGMRYKGMNLIMNQCQPC